VDQGEFKKLIRVALGNVTPQALSQRVARKKEKHAPISDDDALALVAMDARIDISKYLPPEALLRVRAYLGSTPSVTKRPLVKPTKRVVTRNVRIGNNIRIEDPLLTPALLAEAKNMAETVYPVLYVFENSVRQFIVKVLQNSYGEDWWSKVVPKGIREEVAKRKSTEDRNPWHGRRNAHEIFYTDIKHLENIVLSNWSEFKDLLPDNGHAWLTTRIGEIEFSRNIVSHHNPLSAGDIQRVEVHFNDWQRQMKAAQAKLA
jgi:hypothetical protein